jgi:branched-chain amino acid transport system substrate-binding protein
VSTNSGWRSLRRLAMLVVAVGSLSILVAACGSDNTSTEGGGGTATGQANTSECGMGTGEKATGTPIKLGGIATKQPGTDFSEIPKTTEAYFKCVNDNGGINGHPIDYTIETEQTDPGQAANAAVKLVEDVGVSGIAGTSSIIECSVNHKYWEQQGFYVIAAGIAPECYSTSNYASVNMGPRFSSDGATQYVIGQGVDKIVFDQSNVPGTDYIEEGPKLIADDAGLPFKSFAENVPIEDASSIAVKLVQEAGENGGVVLNFTPPEALKILQAAQEQGLQDSVKAWGCSTPCNTDFLAEALGSEWNDKLGVNAELNVTNFDGPDSNLYRQVVADYAPDIPLGSFSQMGFVQGQIATQALLGIQDEDYSPESVNAAFLGVKNFQTDILCNPWYYGEAPLHIPNNVDRTTTPQDGVMVEKEPCFEISAVDPDIAKVRKIEADDPSLVGG